MATYWENSCSFGLRYVSWYKYLIVSLVFSHLSFWSRNLLLIAPFPGLCLLVPYFSFFFSIEIRHDLKVFHLRLLRKCCVGANCFCLVCPRYPGKYYNSFG